jgi:hypothetical protein
MLKARKRAGSLVWFDFATLCEGPRSQLDYLEIARRFAVVIVTGVPRLTPDMGDAARRFTWLVDVLYDHRVKLLLSAAVPAEELYREGPNSQEFPRTVSRLIEMRTHEYMALLHQVGEPAGHAALRRILPMHRFKAYRTFEDDKVVSSRFVEMTEDELDPGDVIVKTKYSTINYKDALSYNGAGRIMRKFPTVGGIDMAGTVEVSADPRSAQDV